LRDCLSKSHDNNNLAQILITVGYQMKVAQVCNLFPYQPLLSLLYSEKGTFAAPTSNIHQIFWKRGKSEILGSQSVSLAMYVSLPDHRGPVVFHTLVCSRGDPLIYILHKEAGKAQRENEHKSIECMSFGWKIVKGFLLSEFYFIISPFLSILFSPSSLCYGMEFLLLWLTQKRAHREATAVSCRKVGVSVTG
jgi:hypothetical protein